MHYVIETKYLGYTDFKASRIKATTSDNGKPKQVTLEYDSSLSQEENHDRAAKALAMKLCRNGTWFKGGKNDNRGNVYVRVDTLNIGGGYEAFTVAI